MPAALAPVAPIHKDAVAADPVLFTIWKCVMMTYSLSNGADVQFVPPVVVPPLKMFVVSVLVSATGPSLNAVLARKCGKP